MNFVCSLEVYTLKDTLCRLTRLESERSLKLRPGTPCSEPVTQPGPSP